MGICAYRDEDRFLYYEAGEYIMRIISSPKPLYKIRLIQDKKIHLLF